MSSLDDKLRAIKIVRLGEEDYNDEFALENEEIAQIKQVFSDEGWYATGEIIENIVEAQENPLMTGQEWADRFEDGIYDQTDVFQEAPDGKSVVLCIPVDSAIEAAKRAAGVK